MEDTFCHHLQGPTRISYSLCSVGQGVREWCKDVFQSSGTSLLRKNAGIDVELLPLLTFIALNLLWILFISYHLSMNSPLYIS